MLLGIVGSASAQSEICDNGIDDNGNGLIDLNDEDCFCEVSDPLSLIPNPSFEEMNCCPNDRSQLDCATDWIQASEPTTDFIHTCDYLGWDQFPPPRPFPDGEGIMGFRDGRVRNNQTEPEPYWKEYAGACLINPLLTDSIYRFQFDVGFVNPDKSPPIDISFFGTRSCEFLPFGVGDEAFGCPTNSPDWIKLKEVRVDGGSGDTWVNTSVEIIPEEDIYAIAIGPDCAPVSSPISIYYFFDNLLLADLEFFDLQVSEIDHPCSNDFVLSVPLNTAFDYQWYLFGVALQGETFHELTQNYGAGDYQVRILDGTTCKLSANFEYRIPEIETEDLVRICAGDVYQFGDNQLQEPGSYLDTFPSQDKCDSIVMLQLEIIGSTYDTVDVSILEGETFELENLSFDEEGNYPLTLSSSLGCDSLVLLRLDVFDVYIPNSFSPNGDGVNDVFFPFIGDDQLESLNIYMYDRWGNLIHQGTEWTGLKMKPGVFAYLIEFNFKNGFSTTRAGDLTLFK